jgi:methyl-accepting chemotaxis protein
MKEWKIFNSISRKFLLPTIALTVVLLTVLGGVMSSTSEEAIRETIDSKGNAVVDFISRFSGDYFAIFDFTDFDNFVKAISTDPDVEFFVIYNAEGEPLTSTMRPPEDLSDLLVYERDITDEFGTVMGILKIGYNKRTLISSVRRNAWIIGVSLMVGIIILSLGITFLTRIVIIKRVDRTVEMLKDIASNEGDLTRRLAEDSDDELGKLATWFNTFVDNIQKIISAVQGSVEQISSSSHQLAVTADKLSTGSKDQEFQTEQVASAMTEMSHTIEDVAKNANDAFGASREALGIAGKGREVVDNTAQGMLRIAQTVKDASETIGELGKSSTEIGNIIQVIDEISDQTNLLALNAAIEAARAGEAGRGFAVVADEVRKLAERTGKATKEIADMIEKIQNETKKSVSSMDAGSTEVETGMTLSGEAKTSLDQIVDSSHKSEDMVQRISAASEEQSVAAEQVSRNMESILVIARKSTESTFQIKSTSEELETLSNELKKMIGLFKV